MFILRNDALMLETLCKVLRGRNFKRISFEWLKAVRLTIKYKCQHLITILTRDWSNPISKKDEDDLLPILYHYRGPGFHAIHQNPDLLDFNDDMYEYDYDGVVNYQVFMLLSYRPKYLKCYGFIADSLMKLGPGPVSDQYLSVISRRNRLIKNLRLIGWSPLDEFIRRFSMKILCQIEATIKSGESLKHVHYLYGPAMIVYAAARLRRKDLVEKYVDEMRVVGSDELSVETFMINAVQGGDWEIIRWFPNWMDIIYDTTCVARDGRILYYLAAMENAQDVIDSILNRSEDPKAFHLELLQGYLASGNYEKVIETSKLITDLMDSDDLLVVIRCDNLSCLEYVEKHWGVIDLDLISSSRFDIHRLTEVLWTLINRDDDTLWRYVFEKLLKTDDFNGLVRITEKFNPKMLSDEEPFDEVIKCTLEGHQFYNSHYLIWLTENCNNSTIIS
ncbi:Hypothetical protein POVR1_LOCUS187 [uncultured virus]|nr:Hypothetical protein POVR1_LOCUS187 [uncultured virus]